MPHVHHVAAVAGAGGRGGPVLQAAEEHRGLADHYSRHALLRQVRQLPVLHQERLLGNLQGVGRGPLPDVLWYMQ